MCFTSLLEPQAIRGTFYRIRNNILRLSWTKRICYLSVDIESIVYMDYLEQAVFIPNIRDRRIEVKLLC